jgi:hypothetical protein
MNSKSPASSPTITALALIASGILLTSWQAVDQPPAAKTATTWQDLGFNLPEGFPTDEIPLFEALDQARGTWSFEGEATDGEGATPLKGTLNITGSPKSGMLPVWNLAWAWPADNPGHSITHVIAAGPREGGFDLMLTRIGPVKIGPADKATPGIRPTLFQGTWDLAKRTITWTERDFPAGRGGQAAEEEQDASKPKETLEMVMAADGKVSIRNSKHAPRGQMTTGKAVTRTGKAPEEPFTLTGKHSFKTAAEVTDPRIKPCLPPQATEISLFSERGGHYARYKVAEADFMTFLDKLWEAGKDKSAHQRDDMHGEGEPASRDSMAKRFKAAGWEPLDNAVVYHSPSKGNGAMTTYYYDREAGIACHDTGYW